MHSSTPRLAFGAGTALLGLVFCALLFFPKHSETVWDFREKQVPGRWTVASLTAAAPTDLGLHIKTDTTGFLQRDPAFEMPAETVSIRVFTGKNTDIILGWHEEGTSSGAMVQLPFTMMGKNEEQVITLNLRDHPEWTTNMDLIAFAVPAGADIVVQEFVFGHAAPRMMLLSIFALATIACGFLSVVLRTKVKKTRSRHVRKKR